MKKIIFALIVTAFLIAGCSSTKVVVVKRVAKSIAAESVRYWPAQKNLTCYDKCCHPVRIIKGKKAYHQVKCGESLSRIAWKYRISLCRIIQLNPWIKNPNHIRPMWMIRVR